MHWLRTQRELRSRSVIALVVACCVALLATTASAVLGSIVRDHQGATRSVSAGGNGTVGGETPTQ